MSTQLAATVVVVVAGSTLFGLVRLATSSQLRLNYRLTLRSIRWWMVPAGLANLSLVLLLFFGLTRIAPWLWVGWWRLLGGTSNVWLGQTSQSGTWWQCAAILIPIAVLFLLPILAHGEEIMFRLGSERQSRPARFRRQLWFGLVHCATAGVPLAAGFALTLSGFYFEWIYLRAMRRLTPEIQAAQRIPEFARTPFPEAPSGPRYDADVWDRHRKEFDAVSESNRLRLEEWIEDEPARTAEVKRRVTDLKGRAIAEAAAAHTVSNGLVVGALLVFLLLAQLRS
jgi:hypothetical protein